MNCYFNNKQNKNLTHMIYKGFIILKVLKDNMINK